MSLKAKIKILLRTKTIVLINLKLKKQSQKRIINNLLKKISFMDLGVQIKSTFMEDRQ